MNNKKTKTALIVLGSVGGAAAIGTMAVSVWSSKRMRTMRMMKKANLVLHRIGSALCKLSDVADDCM